MGTHPLSYDVVVVGGGARTALVERYGFLGGMATAGMVSTICGLYRTSSAGPAEPLNPGVAETFAQRLTAMPGCGAPVRRGRTHVLPYTPFAFACLADEVAAEAPGLDVYRHAYLVGLDAPASHFNALRISTWERTQELRAHAVVDTTGDAVVAHRAGAATETALVAERQLSSVVLVLQNANTDALGPGARVALARALVSAERAGGLPKGASNLAVGPSLAEQEGRKRILAIPTLLKTMPAFTRAFVSHAAPQVGVREGRRVIGACLATGAAAGIAAARYPDS